MKVSCISVKQMTEEISNPLSETFSNLNRIFFRCKDSLSDSECFELKTYRKNLVTKIYCEGSVYSKPVVFLFAVSLLDTKRMIEVVKAGLESAQKNIVVNYDVDKSSVDEIREFIRSANTICVEHIDNSILISSNGEKLNIFTTDIDDAAKHLLVRSLCVFLAICGKTVTNNIDNIKLNDYGCIEN